jgi:hypothetical protein
LALAADSTLERDASIRLRVTASDGRPRAIAVRQPAWAAKIAFSLNGVAVAPVQRGGYLRVSGNWKSGDTLVLRYQMKTRAERTAANKRVALFHGPWLLAIDDQLSPGFQDEPRAENRLRIAIASDGSVDLDRARPTHAEPFTVPEARFRVNYLPGGYPMLPAEAILRPVAEQTSTRSLAWDFQFLTGN